MIYVLIYQCCKIAYILCSTNHFGSGMYVSSPCLSCVHVGVHEERINATKHTKWRQTFWSLQGNDTQP